MSSIEAVRPRPAAKWRSFEAWVGTRASVLVLFTVSLAVFALQSIFLPAYPGRDMARYLQAFVQLGYEVPIYPAVLNTRGPLAALGVGVPLEGGGWAAELFLAALYALSIVAWGRVAYTFGPRAAVLTSALLLVYPGYGILFHQLASDALFAAGFAGWAVLLARAICHPSTRIFAVVGLVMGALVLIRPGNHVLIAMTLLPLLVRTAWRDRLAWFAAFFISFVLVVQTWKAVAELRFGDAVALEPSTGLVALALASPRWRSKGCPVKVRRSTRAPSSGTSRTSSCSARSSSTGSSLRRTARRRGGWRESSDGSYSRESPTARTASTCTSSSPPGAIGSSAISPALRALPTWRERLARRSGDVQGNSRRASPGRFGSSSRSAGCTRPRRSQRPTLRRSGRGKRNSSS